MLVPNFDYFENGLDFRILAVFWCGFISNVPLEYFLACFFLFFYF